LTELQLTLQILSRQLTEKPGTDAI